MSESWKVSTINDLDPVIKHMQNTLQIGDIVLFRGQVGAGKTTLINKFVNSIGGSNPNSPTFAIHNQYETSFARIHHLDLYRLTDDEDLYSTGLEDFLADKNAIIFIEWAERLSQTQLPRNRRVFKIHIDVEDQNRKIIWSTY